MESTALPLPCGGVLLHCRHVVAAAGRIGSALAQRGSGFSMRVLSHDICVNTEAEKLGVRFVSTDESLAESDFLSLHAVLHALGIRAEEPVARY